MIGSLHVDGVLRLIILVKMMMVNLKEAAIEVCNVDDTAAGLITAHLKLVRTKITVASLLAFQMLNV